MWSFWMYEREKGKKGFSSETQKPNASIQPLSLLWYNYIVNKDTIHTKNIIKDKFEKMVKTWK